jgi:hypothetical protein
MNDLYSTDHHALKEALDKKGWSPEMLSTFSGVHPGTVLRILSLRYPKSMKPERRDVARGAIICRLSKALRIRPQVLAPDLPELPPSPNPPAGPPRSLMGEITAGLMPHGRGAASFARSKTHWIWRLPDMARKNHRNRTAFLKTPTARNKYAVRRWKSAGGSRQKRGALGLISHLSYKIQY